MSLDLHLRVPLFGQRVNIQIFQPPSNSVSTILDREGIGNEAITLNYIEWYRGQAGLWDWDPTETEDHVRHVWLYGTHALAQWTAG